MLLPIVFPGPVERMLTGFGQTDVAGQSTTDDYSMTSGRTQFWPHVIDKIGESPIVGHGRMAMMRTGLTKYLRQEYGQGEAVSHPHNMYLETLLDNGILGSIPILLFWGIIVIYSGQLFRSSNRLCSAVGGLALSLMLAQLVAGVGSQHFYPEESTLGLWAAIFLSIRVYVERTKAQIDTITTEGSWEGQLLQQQQMAISTVRA
jgi:O-antigen ligase